MKDHDRTYTSLSKHVQSGIGPDDEARVCRLRLAAYRERRVAVIHLDEVLGWDIRAIIENETKRQLRITK